MKKKYLICLFVFLMLCYRRHAFATAFNGLSEQGGCGQEPSVIKEIPVTPIYPEDGTGYFKSMPQMPDLPERFRASALMDSYLSACVPASKNQGQYGGCWTFAAIAASEASAWQRGLINGEPDFSEWQLAYFCHHPVEDILGGTKGDSFMLGSNEESYMEIGGNAQFATMRFANWLGPVYESDAPYETILEDADAKLHEETAYDKDVLHLENALWISMKDTEYVKQMIMEYGAGATAYYTSSAYYQKDFVNNYQTYFCPYDEESNHAVAIIGWDDNYKKEKFKNMPSKDGAWLCRNTWNSDWSANNYFWISYEEASLINSNVYFFDYGENDNYAFNYQYDGGVSQTYWAGLYDSEANVFEAKGEHILKAVGFYTADSQYQCSIKIYKDCIPGNPQTGELVMEQDADQLYAGYHTVVLEKRVSLEPGEIFSVVIEQKTKDNTRPKIWVDASRTMTYQSNGVTKDYYVNTSCAKKGQSYVKGDEGWEDISEENINCRIKAFMDGELLPYHVILDKEALTMEIGESKRMVATVLPGIRNEWDVAWYSENEEVVRAADDGTIQAVAGGTANIVCKVKGYETKAVCKITVIQKVETLSFLKEEQTIECGQTLQLQAHILPGNATNQQLEWYCESLDEVGQVSQTGVVTAGSKEGTIIVGCRTTDGSNLNAVCRIHVIDTKSADQGSSPVGEEKIYHSKGYTKKDEETKAYYRITKEGNGGSVEYVKPDGTAQTSVEIKNMIKMDGVEYKVTAIAPNAFRKSPDLYEIVIENGITAIGKNAFYGCKKLKKVVLGNKVKKIGEGAFYGCSRLKKVVFGPNVTSIGKKAFYKCTALSAIELPAKVNKIGSYAFYKCIGLKRLTIRSKLLRSAKVGKKAFYGIYKKVVVRLPRKKYVSYKKIFRKRGVSSKAKYRKM